MDHPDREPWAILVERICTALPVELTEPMKSNLIKAVDSVPSYADDILRVDLSTDLGPPQQPAQSFSVEFKE
jgi:hypothetical protein